MKWLIVAGLIYIVLGWSISNVHANAGPHGGYTATTDACAGCHRTHSAGAAGLLISAQPALCFTCHGSSSTGAVTNVQDGVYTGPGGGNLLSGGFANYQGAPVSSTHSVDGTWQPMWGSGGGSGECDYCHDALNIPIDPSIPMTVEFMQNPISGNMNSLVQLRCTNCHDVHGNNNYRILRFADYCNQPPGPWDSHSPSGFFGTNVPCAVVVTSNEPTGTQNYTSPSYKTGMTDWCSTCHANYRNTTDTKSLFGTVTPLYPYDALDGNGNVTRYRHDPNALLAGKTTTLPVEDPSGNGADISGNPANDDRIFCLTCHFAHGTNVAATGLTANVAPTHDSALLRLDNRGVCENCHKK
jgi:predicted CXXCH cytochrome family protein